MKTFKLSESAFLMENNHKIFWHNYNFVQIASFKLHEKGFQSF